MKRGAAPAVVAVPRTTELARAAYASTWAWFCLAPWPSQRQAAGVLLNELRPYTTYAQDQHSHVREFNRWATTLPGFVAYWQKRG